jgi:AraC-like DNA-binding protein
MVCFAGARNDAGGHRPETPRKRATPQEEEKKPAMTDARNGEFVESGQSDSTSPAPSTKTFRFSRPPSHLHNYRIPPHRGRLATVARKPYGVFPIVGSSGLLSIDLGLRGAVVGLSLLIAGVALRDRRDSTVACLGAAVLVGAAASAIGSAPTFPRPFAWWGLLALALSGGNSVVFWLWARAAFDDDFVVRPWHGGLWAVIAGLQFYVAGWSLWPTVDLAIDRTLSLTTLGLAVLAAAQTLATWRTDLVAGRRRQRLVVLIGASTYIVIVAAVNFSGTPSMSFSSMASVANAFGLFGLVGLSAWNVLRAADTQGSILLPATYDAPGSARATARDGAGKPPEIEQALLRRLEQLMAVERAYRREGLTIGSLSAGLGVPEYRLRQLINEGLGHRNFNAFLNRYRIEDAKAALADPEQREVPVLTIAMDAGFQSVGPFNRAFRAATDLTPTEFRRLAMAKHASMLPMESVSSGIGKPD